MRENSDFIDLKTDNRYSGCNLSLQTQLAKSWVVAIGLPNIAEYPTDAQTSKEIIEFADQMMYVSKKTGRGKVYHIGHVGESN